MSTVVKFRFRHVNEKGQPHFLSRGGRFDGETLRIGRRDYSIFDIERVEHRFGHLVLWVRDQGKLARVALANIRRKKARLLRREIVVACSSCRAQLHREELEAQGLGDEFGFAVCPHCEATVDLSGCPETPQFYCPYCDTLSTGAEDAPKHESRLHVCDHCGYYAQPEEYSIFYFIFLLVFFAWSSKRVRMCHACVRPEVWKMLAGNLLFVIALPAAVVQLVRAYYGGPTRSREFAELDRGNLLAKKGRAAEAANAYEAICQRVPAAAGVRYNHGLALVRAGQIMEAAEQFEAALGDCANYEPGYTMLAHCYQRLRDVDRLHALQQSWRIHPPPATDTPAATDLAADAYGRAAA